MSKLTKALLSATAWSLVFFAFMFVQYEFGWLTQTEAALLIKGAVLMNIMRCAWDAVGRN